MSSVTNYCKRSHQKCKWAVMQRGKTDLNLAALTLCWWWWTMSLRKLMDIGGHWECALIISWSLASYTTADIAWNSQLKSLRIRMIPCDNASTIPINGRFNLRSTQLEKSVCSKNLASKQKLHHSKTPQLYKIVWKRFITTIIHKLIV